MRLIFMGTPETAVPSLRRCVEDGHEVVAVWTQPDRPAGRGHQLTSPPVKEYALAQGLTVHQPSKIRTEEALALFSSGDADACIVVAYGRILPATFLSAPRRGCINVHFSLLPKYRGAAPVNWAIARGESQTGVTTMLMDEGLDTGPILLQRAVQVGERETAPELLARLSTLGADLLSETLKSIGELPAQPQTHEAATLAPILRREDGKIDWSLDAQSIERRVRGFQPWPNAYTEHESRRLVVWRAESLADTSAAAQTSQPGQVVEAQGEQFVVRCGDATALRLLELQLEGKRRTSARDFLNGARLRAGDRLG